MKFRVVIDTNIWIRILLKGRVTLPILEAGQIPVGDESTPNGRTASSLESPPVKRTD